LATKRNVDRSGLYFNSVMSAPDIVTRVTPVHTAVRIVREMKVGPSESLCRWRLQTAISCFGQAVVEGNCNAFDLASCFLRFLTPAIENLQQCVDHELLQRLAPGAPRPTVSTPICSEARKIAALKPLDNLDPIQGTSGSNREAESTDAPERGGLPRSSSTPVCRPAANETAISCQRADPGELRALGKSEVRSALGLPNREAADAMNEPSRVR
jgi:hypothetical protein